MKPIAVHSCATVRAPAGFVWDFLRVYDNDLAWRSGLQKMAQSPSGAVRNGARVEETLRVLGRTVESLVEVRDVHEGHSFSWRVVEGSNAEGSRSVTPTDTNACRVDLVKRVTLSGGDRLLRPVISAVIRRTEHGDVQRVKRLLEQAWKDR
ncbi:SRPBCC family protein [Nocardiopsis valliformis]|uniref:SRPBCC family protein n=1 Tax=Nocardiopsis valliformis TaxID=239974 RepID=UPI00034C2026|nr:SRPBCC family protein [Nocardiopsis valliformis]